MNHKSTSALKVNERDLFQFFKNENTQHREIKEFSKVILTRWKNNITLIIN